MLVVKKTIKRVHITHEITPSDQTSSGKMGLPEASNSGKMSHVEREVAIMEKIVPSANCIPGQDLRPKPKTRS